MENEEKYIREKAGRENHFRVPEGYFEQLTERVMSQLPEHAKVTPLSEPAKMAAMSEPQRKSHKVKFRLWYYAAACIAAIAVMGITYQYHQEGADEQPVVAAVETNTENSYIDEVADYAMLDNSEIYAYLADD